MSPRWLLALAAPTLLLVEPGAASADEPPGCPPEEWFCDDASHEPEAPLSSDETAPEDVPPDDTSAPPPDFDDDRGPASRDTIDVRRSASSRSSEFGWSEGSGGRGASPWGLALRIQGVMLDGKGRADGANLGGVGVSGRYTVNRVVTLDGGLDSILGTDYNGYDRSELSLSFSSLFYLNQHPVLRTYVLVGLNISSARVNVAGDDQTWSYFGGQSGLGLDIALDSRITLNVDALAFIRGRTDERAAREPEFTDGLGRVTNTSGGGLLRGGITLHF